MTLKALREIDEEATRIKAEYEEGRTWLRGLCTNGRSTYRLSKRAAKLKIKADRQREKNIQRLATTRPPEPAIELETPTIEDHRTTAQLSSTQRNKEEVLSHIADDRISVIDVVIMVTISEHHIRERIRKRLHLNLAMCDDEDKKHKLLGVLRVPNNLGRDWISKKWEFLNRKRRMVVVSRKKDVCHNMEAECTVEVKKLSWILFLDKAGHHISSPLIDTWIGEWCTLRYCIAEGVVADTESMKAFGNKGHAMIEALKRACMIQDGHLEKSERMHNMLCELAIWITSSGVGLKQAPEASRCRENLIDGQQSK
ncbi:hypothetical protein AMTR_s00029p00115280 [Amborella trichopoda]|uniref:NB-ARC domain-containing protein n=1 Tax=Amborella trichopoda TaxID=13333 RepID=W1PQK1_AMBTC|nr:hypothetical protein AMTR_s00029p00115280 [Amborella trichopoda]